MAADDARARYLRDRVLTATPAQRVVMLYDRLGLDLLRAEESSDSYDYGQHASHALDVLTELRTSLDVHVGGPAQNLASLYGFLFAELIAARSGERERIATVRPIVATLREAWSQAGEEAPAAAAAPLGGSSARWVG